MVSCISSISSASQQAVHVYSATGHKTLTKDIKMLRYTAYIVAEDWEGVTRINKKTGGTGYFDKILYERIWIMVSVLFVAIKWKNLKY